MGKKGTKTRHRCQGATVSIGRISAGNCTTDENGCGKKHQTYYIKHYNNFHLVNEDRKKCMIERVASEKRLKKEKEIYSRKAVKEAEMAWYRGK